MNEDNISENVHGNYNVKYNIDAAPEKDGGMVKLFITSEKGGQQVFKGAEKAINYLIERGVPTDKARKVLTVGRRAFRLLEKSGGKVTGEAWSKFLGHEIGVRGGIGKNEKFGKEMESDKDIR